jgi:hypothetical protein
MSQPEQPDADYAADDPSDTIQTERISTIFDARDRVIEQKRFAKDGVVFGEFGEATKNEIIRDAVEDYIRELRWLIAQNADKTNRDYLSGIMLGQMQCPDGGVVEFAGLTSILSSPRPFEFRITEEKQTHTGGRQIEERVVTKNIPEHILLNAFSVCNEFFTEIGLDVRIERATDPVFGFEVVDDA